MGVWTRKIIDLLEDLGYTFDEDETEYDPQLEYNPVREIRRGYFAACRTRKLADPEPRRIVQRIVQEAVAYAVPWSGGVLDYPDTFVISVSPATWRDYYGRDPEACCRRIEQEAQVRLAAYEDVDIVLHVALACDGDLEDGAWRCETSFGCKEAGNRAGTKGLLGEAADVGDAGA